MIFKSKELKLLKCKNKDRDKHVGINREEKAFFIKEPAQVDPGRLPQCHGLWSCLVSSGDHPV